MIVIPKKLDNGSDGPYVSSRGQPKSHEDHISLKKWQRKNEFNCCRGIADSTKLQDRAISWPPENLLIELLTGIVTTVNVNTYEQSGAGNG